MTSNYLLDLDDRCQVVFSSKNSHQAICLTQDVFIALLSCLYVLLFLINKVLMILVFIAVVAASLPHIL